MEHPKLSDCPQRIVIVGGGVTGLSTAYHLQKAIGSPGKDIEITLLEQSARLGGKLISEHSDGFLIEGGPDCFLTRKPWALEVCRELGLEDDLMGTNKAQRKVHVLSDGTLHPLPEGIMLIVPTKFLPFALSSLISIPGKIRMAMDLFIPPRRENGDETLGHFVRRRLGQEALDKIAEPLLSGIHVADADRLSLKASFPRLMAVEEKYGSLTRGMIAAKRKMIRSKAEAKQGGRQSLPIFVSLQDGMQQYVDTLADALDAHYTFVRLNSKVETITSIDSAPPYIVQLTDGRQLYADELVLTTPANVTAELVNDLDQDLSQGLDDIRFVSTAVVSLAYRNGPGIPKFDGFGFIIPKSEERRITACTFSSAKFDNRTPEGYQMLRCFMGGPGREEILKLDDEALAEVAAQEVAQIVGVEASPVLARTFRWTKLNPQYDLNHLDRVADLRNRAAELGGLSLAGCSYDGVGVPDCTRQGKEAAAQIIERIPTKGIQVRKEERICDPV
jgi:protoporphyrinogen/coproporphyrinogen III oxidase